MPHTDSDDSIFSASPFDRDGWFVVMSAAWEVYLDESESESGDLVVAGGAFGTRDTWIAIRNYCEAGRIRFEIPFSHRGKMRQLGSPYYKWRSLPDGGIQKKQECMSYFCSFPRAPHGSEANQRGVAIVAANLSKTDYTSVFSDKGMRGRVGNAFAVCADACLGHVEAMAEKHGVEKVYYFVEEGPLVASVTMSALQYGRTVTAVPKRSEPATDIADAVSYEYFHYCDDSLKGKGDRPRTALDLLLRDCDYTFLDIRKGALLELYEAARLWGRPL